MSTPKAKQNLGVMVTHRISKRTRQNMKDGAKEMEMSGIAALRVAQDVGFEVLKKLKYRVAGILADVFLENLSPKK